MTVMVGLYASLFKNVRDVIKGIPDFISNSFARLKKMIAISRQDSYNNVKELFLWKVSVF